MISEAHSEAARINGAKSNGPKTPEGKAASSANSLRHGCTAKAILLTNEEPQAYCQLAEGYYTALQPTNDVECDIVDEMVISKWLQRRDWSNEAALFDLEMDDQAKKLAAEFPKIDPASRYAMAFKALADGSKAIQLFIRYETGHRRAYYKALETFLKLRTKLPPGAGPVEPPVEPAAEPDPEPLARKTDSEPVENNLYETNPANTEPATNNHEPATQNPGSDEKPPSSDPQGDAPSSS
jgi:hypothetical protein